MPGTDDRIRDALRVTAREPSVDGVVERVRGKRQRRRMIRRVETGVFVAAVITAAAVMSANLLGDPDRRPEIAVPPRPTEGPVVRVADGLDTEAEGAVAKVTPVRVQPDEGYVRGPLFVQDGRLTFAAYNRVGSSWEYPPSRIIRVRSDGTEIDRVLLEGEILSFTVGEGVRWALTHDKTVTDAEFRVKRIAPDNTHSTSSLPLGEQPVGDIVADGGGVWVPVRDGVLRFDPVTGRFANKVTLSTITDRRAVVGGTKAVFATDGLQDVQLDPASSIPPGVIGDVTAAGVDEVVDAEESGVHLGRNRDGTRWSLVYADATLALPPGISEPTLRASAGSIWVDAATDGNIVLQLDIGDGRPRVDRTISIDGAGDRSDVFVTFIDADTMFVTSEGRLYRVDL